MFQGQGPLGLNLHLQAEEKLENIKKKHEAHFIWVQEILAEAKRTFSSPEIQLLPKTPSVKRTRQMRKVDSEEDDTDSKKRPKRTRKNKKVDDTDSETGVDSGSSAKSTRASRSTRSTRASRTQTLKEEAPARESPRLRLGSKALKKCEEEDAGDSASPAGVKHVSVIAEEVFTEAPPSPKPRTPAKVKASSSPAPSPNRPAKPSPKPIPGFTGLNVKGKATAYEEFVASPGKGVASGDESGSPRRRNALCRVLDSLRKSNSPRRQLSPGRGTPPKKLSESKPAVNRGTITIPPTEETEMDINVEEEMETEKETERSRRSSRRSSHVVSKPSAVRSSLSQRRSSLMRHKIRQSTTRSSSIRRTPSKARKPTPAPITLGDGPVVASDATQSDSQPEASSADDDVKRTTPDTPKSSRKARPTPDTPRSTRKVRQPASNESDADAEDETDLAFNSKTPVPLPRTTRSKLRLNKPAPAKLPVGSSEDETAPEQPAPTRSTRSKLRLNKAAPPKLPIGSSDDDVQTEPSKSTRSKMRVNKNTTDSPSLKRPQQDADVDPSPPKKQCLGGAGSESDEIVYKTPSPPCPRNKAIRGQAQHQTSSFLSHLKKTVNTPSNLSTTITSFIKRNTPMKTTVPQDREIKKRRDVEAKNEATEQRINKRQELLQQRAEEQRRRREERQTLAARRREENQKKTLESRNENQQRQEEKKDLKARMAEEKLKEERERQKLREKKLAIAEQKRKEEEENRLQKIRQAEAEARRQEEALQRKREFEDAERQRNLAEQRRQEEERRQEAIRERQLEMQRMHKDGVEKQKKEAEERRIREEELKRERQERERRELQEKQERERVRMAELDKIREKERMRLQTEAAAAAAQKEEERRAREAIQKHNSALKPNTSLMNSSNNQPTQPGPSAKPTLNTTVTKETNPDSYEMTPTKKHVRSKNPNNYGIDDLHSDDSTDDEEAPKRITPAWASGSNLKAAMINQHYHPPDLDNIFPMIQMPDLNLVFKRKKPRFNKRTSSACWDSPILKHSVAHF